MGPAGGEISGGLEGGVVILSSLAGRAGSDWPERGAAILSSLGAAGARGGDEVEWSGLREVPDSRLCAAEGAAITTAITRGHIRCDFIATSILRKRQSTSLAATNSCSCR